MFTRNLGPFFLRIVTTIEDVQTYRLDIAARPLWFDFHRATGEVLDTNANDTPQATVIADDARRFYEREAARSAPSM